ncbi:PA0069 family radical SAM protein [Fulvivirga sedimenti]|uniref:PA0069 family radical SAM protein n=1 Tax=Fulvivirga sedimenti TaxID=2879465 RepID=A0A9X1HZE3_9BACT|nr:PA0069 family radical SAM protein [Fulvivirga sedimenti]MCA6079229.1 PA0069 family radical SAM protein [Fulvivirga sedimenti]
MESTGPIKGRGTSLNTKNRYLRQHIAYDHPEGLDEPMESDKPETELFFDSAANIVNKVTSPDVGMMYSANPYQGCEHGCVYCYARNTHEYWGWNAGLDFERKIIVKKDAPLLLEKFLLQKSWIPQPIVLSGNTDCYQPVEQKLKLTRKMLEVFAKYRHPVGIITKNTTVLRDLDILKDLAADNLVHVYFSITTLNEDLRRVMEPRTATSNRKFEAISELTKAGVPVGIMNAPLIPGINHHEIPAIIRAAANAGARSAGYTVVRLNGPIGDIFKKWLADHYPDRIHKVINQISDMHGGKVNDSEWGVRIKGQGNFADIISRMFRLSKEKYMAGMSMPPYNTGIFRKGGNFRLF